MKEQFNSFQSPTKTAHFIWNQILESHHIAIDATCGGGYDTQFLAQKCHRVFSLDLQKEALDKAKSLLSHEERQRVSFYHQSHVNFPVVKSPIQLIVYNLGYLPGGDKSITTRVESTLVSVQAAIELITTGGFISITCYPGHEEGYKEKLALVKFLQQLCPRSFSVSHQVWVNRNQAPSLLIIQKCV